MILWKEKLKSTATVSEGFGERPIGDYAYQVPYKELVSALSR